MLMNYVTIKMSEIQDSKTRVDFTLEDAFSRLGKLQKLSAARTSMSNFSVVLPKNETPSGYRCKSRMMDDLEVEEEDHIKMVATLDSKLSRKDDSPSSLSSPISISNHTRP